MRVLKIVRWKVLIVVAVVFLVLDLFVVPNYLAAALTRNIEDRLETTARIEDAELDLTEGRLVIKNLRIDDPIDRSRWLMVAEEIDMDVEVTELFRRKIVAKHIRIHNPKMDVKRTKDGDLNVDPTAPEGMDPEEVIRRAGEIYEKYKTGKGWYDKIRAILARVRAAREIEAENPDEVARLRGFTKLPEVGPRLVLDELTVDGIEITFSGEEDGDLPKILAGKIQGLALSSSPGWYKDPLKFAANANLDELAGPLFKLSFGMDAEDKAKWLWAGVLDTVPVQRIKNFVKDNIPVELISGNITTTWNGHFRRLDSFELRPVLIFEDLVVKPKAGIANVAGFAAGALTKELSLAGKFALTDIRIHGDPFNPTIDLGDTMSTLMRMGGEAFARQFGAAMADKLLGQLAGKIPGGENLLGLPRGLLGGEADLGKAIQGNLGEMIGGALGGAAGGGASGGGGFQGIFDQITKGGTSSGETSPGGAIGDALGGVLGGDKKKGEKPDVKKAAEGLLKGVLGGPDKKKKDDEKDGGKDAKKKKPDPIGGLLNQLGGKKKKDGEK